ncbi:T9SS type A sorting domain-containing protein [Chryseobacterium scophthalmum]|uniref:T9SS type A sorting domain-containing protein n=1 Tax=Chryseobacterium scophthalmum TaxID=59733 RepID=UPI000C9DF0D0|nr:T9SS type A sorting domain-containing protein [Chryseobacterium scophthalmum]
MMGKLHLILIMAISSLAFGQNISFETSEGYTLSDINNQQGWSYWGGVTPNTAVVVNTTSTLGSNSVNVISNNSTNDGGIMKNVIGFTKTEYSFDYKISGIDGSDYYMAVQDNNNTVLAGFSIDYEQGNVSIYDGILDDGVPTSINLSPNTWYNFKMIVNMASHSVEYFINNSSLGSKNFLTTATGFNVINFVYDDFGSGFSLDNIKILNASNLSVSENVKNSPIDIYPNPTSDFINIKIRENIESVEILDSSGKLVLNDSSGRKQVSVSFLQNGLYVLKIKTKNSTYTKKFNKK